MICSYTDGASDFAVTFLAKASFSLFFSFIIHIVLLYKLPRFIRWSFSLLVVHSIPPDVLPRFIIQFYTFRATKQASVLNDMRHG
jgi:hypothetical protein